MVVRFHSLTETKLPILDDSCSVNTAVALEFFLLPANLFNSLWHTAHPPSPPMVFNIARKASGTGDRVPQPLDSGRTFSSLTLGQGGSSNEMPSYYPFEIQSSSEPSLQQSKFVTLSYGWKLPLASCMVHILQTDVGKMTISIRVELTSVLRTSIGE